MHVYAYVDKLCLAKISSEQKQVQLELIVRGKTKMNLTIHLGSTEQVLKIGWLVVESVADVRFCQQIIRIHGIVFNLLAQLTYVCPQVL